MLKSYVDKGTAAGFVTIAARHGHVASLDAVGYQDREARIPMRTDTIFRIMSMTKSFTAAGVMILVDEGRLSLLDPVEQFLPEFKGIKVNPVFRFAREPRLRSGQSIPPRYGSGSDDPHLRPAGARRPGF